MEYDGFIILGSIANDAVCAIGLAVKGSNGWGGTVYAANIVNNANVPIHEMISSGKSFMDAKMVDIWGVETVQLGKVAEDVFSTLALLPQEALLEL